MHDIKVKNLNEISLPKEVKNILDILISLDKPTYLIGGYVRDLILNKESYDFDFTLVDNNAFDFAVSLEKEFNGKAILLDEETGTTRFVLKEDSLKHYSFDFTSVNESDLENDFSRRDFSINAMAINLKDPEVLIDKFNGVKDLNEKVIKAINLDNLIDDSLRMLRAFRFAALIDGEIDKSVTSYIQNNLSKYNPAEERTMLEFWKILNSKNPSKYIKLLAEVGLLEKIIPELTKCREVSPNDFHHLGLFDHSIYLLETFEDQYIKIPSRAKAELEEPYGDALLPTRKNIAQLGSIFHDIGKPDTWEIKKIDGGEKHTFIGHDKVGGEITKAICKRLKISKSASASLASLVRHHLRPYQLSNGHNPITDKALFRFFRDVGDDIPMLLILALADHYATLGPKADEEHLKYGENLILYLFDEYYKHVDKQKEINSKPRLLDGKDVMQITGLSESPELGSIMKKLDEAISVGEVKTKKDAVDWVKKVVSN